MSTLKLYSSSSVTPWRLLPHLLFKVENIDGYLAQFTPETINNFQYIRNQLEVSIKIQKSQNYASIVRTGGYKYVTIENDSENKAYYYVKHVSQKSQNTIQLDLVLDTANTYTDGVDFNFKKNTRIIREHKNRLVIYSPGDEYRVDGSIDTTGFVPDIGDRIYINLTALGASDAIVEVVDFSIAGEWFIFKVISGSLNVGRMNLYNNERYEDADLIEFYATTITPANDEICRNIDVVPENINPILNSGNGLGIKVQDKAPFNIDWYLLYRNQNDPSDVLVNPVECYLIPSVEVDTDSAYIQNGRLIPSFLEEGKMYAFRVGSGESATLSNGVTASYDNQWYSRVYVTKAGNKINAMFFRSSDITGELNLVWQYDDIDFITFTGLPVPYNVYNIPHSVTAGEVYNTTFDYNFNNSGSLSTLDDINKLDKTDAKNIKLIKLPYCPYKFNVSGTTLQIASDLNWEYASIAQSNGGDIYVLKLKSLNTLLNKTITDDNVNPFSAYKVGSKTDIDPEITDLRYTGLGALSLESKLFHSEFYQPKLIYDSFTYTFELEKLSQSSYYPSNANYLEIKFVMTRTINSKFLFKMNTNFALAESNYADIVSIARNNEEVLYNTPYINYIRTGYNYDIKNKNMTNASNWIGLGVSGLSMAVSAFAPTAPVKVMGIVASLISMASSVKSTIVNTIQNENNIKQKILQTQNQTASVSGSDDVDLMSEYSGNRLKYLIYRPTANIITILENLFFYAGYNSGRTGIPTHNNRVNFDYLECDAVIESLKSNMSQEILEEIKNTYKVGVTYIHETDRNTDKWDIEQKYENWEVALLED